MVERKGEVREASKIEVNVIMNLVSIIRAFSDFFFLMGSFFSWVPELRVFRPMHDHG